MTGEPCRTIFVGAVEEGRRCLDALMARGERFTALVTLEDDLAARTSGAVPFDDAARAQGIPLLKVRDLNAEENVRKVGELRPDLILVIGWTRLLGRRLLEMPRLGCIGFHASLLPKYRGRAPVNWALINGETETGNTMFFLDEGVDTGDIIAQRRIPIAEDDTCATLYRKIADSAIAMLEENLPLLKQGRAPRRPQDHAAATVMPKRRPEDGAIDWSRGPRALYDWVRALTHPYPGAFSHLDGRRLFVWRAARSAGVDGDADAMPGTLLGARATAMLVATGKGGILALERVQWQDGPEIDGADLSGQAGRRFDGAGESR